MCITANGAIACVWGKSDGRTINVHIVRTQLMYTYSVFLEIIETYDQIMDGGGFNIKTDLVMSQCTLAIPPSVACGSKMTTSQAKQTSAENM